MAGGTTNSSVANCHVVVLGPVRLAWSVTVLTIGQLVDIDLNGSVTNSAIDADV